MWDYGHELFKSTPESFPVGFVAGDAFDPAIIAPREPFYEPREIVDRPRDLRSLSSLTPLQGTISVIHATFFFHLFGEARQLELARRLATLLLPAPGSTIFGVHIGSLEKGLQSTDLTRPGKYIFCHSPESWKDMWDGDVFRKGTVRVTCGLKKKERNESGTIPGAEYYWLWWSVTRM